MKILKSPEKALRAAISAVEKRFGEGAVMLLGKNSPPKVEALSTGSLGVDLALGVGGIPRGRIVEIYGPESSGKTTLALHVIAEAHRAGELCAFIDAEHAMDTSYAEALGVHLDKLLLSQPESGEQALEICETLVRSGSVSLVVIDSVAALVPQAEIDGEMGDAHVGLQARLISQAMRKLTGITHRTGCTLIFINQLRQKPGVVFGNPEVTPGGNALKFYASVRIEIRRLGAIKQGDRVVGNRTRVKVVKNKVAPPFAQVEVDIFYGRGISREADLLERALEHRVVHQVGSWFLWGERRLGQGRGRGRQALEADPDLFSALLAAVLKQVTASARPDSPTSPDG